MTKIDAEVVEKITEYYFFELDPVPAGTMIPAGTGSNLKEQYFVIFSATPGPILVIVGAIGSY